MFVIRNLKAGWKDEQICMYGVFVSKITHNTTKYDVALRLQCVMVREHPVMR